MQFTKSTIALVAGLMAAKAYGLPAALTAEACGTTPSGTEPHEPLGSPNADTAHACQEACTQETSCKSFAFGLPPRSSAPECKLFGVKGAQVPKQDSNVVAFDVACSNIPTGKPSQANPVGVMHQARGEAGPPNPLATEPQEPKLQDPKPQETKPAEPAPKGPKARGEPIPPPAGKPQEPKPQETKPAQPAPEGPKARGEPISPPPPAGKPQEPKPQESKPAQPAPEGPKARGEPTTPPPPADKPQEPKPQDSKPAQPAPQGPKARREAKTSDCSA